jgi:NAD+ synthetase
LLNEAIKSPEVEAVLVGYVSTNHKSIGKPIRNSVALLHKGKIVAIRHKTLLPTYDVFDEARYFASANENLPISWSSTRLGVTICEDAWAEHLNSSRQLYTRNPINVLVRSGAEFLLNLSASPFVHGKTTLRRRLLSTLAKKHKRPLYYCNLVGGNDEVLFDGGSLAFDSRGKLRARGAFASEDLILVDSEQTNETPLATEPTDIAQVMDMLIMGIRDFADKCGLKTAFIGLSGGIDSAVVAALAVRALSAQRVIGIAMPSSYSSPDSITDAKELAQNLGIEFKTIPIQGIYQSYLQSFGPGWGEAIPDLAEQNLQARARGTILMSLSNKSPRGFVLTTGNKSELAVGYCTLYGDMCGALAPIADVPKRMVYALAEFINHEHSVIPTSSILKAPSAELKPNQKDADDLPPYGQVDDALEAWVQDRLSPQRITKTIGDRTVTELLLDRMDSTEFKRRQAAPALKISSKAFGIGRRIPIAKAGWRARLGL